MYSIALRIQHRVQDSHAIAHLVRACKMCDWVRVFAYTIRVFTYTVAY